MSQILQEVLDANAAYAANLATRELAMPPARRSPS